MANNFEITLPAQAFVAAATNGPSLSYVQDRLRLDYDDSTKETAYSAAFRMPAAYTGTGTLFAVVQYAMASATSGTVEFEVAVEAVTPADALNLNSASSFDTANSGTETVPGTAGYLSEIAITLTNKDSVAAGDLVRLSLARDAADATNDTATGDARVLGVTIFEEA